MTYDVDLLCGLDIYQENALTLILKQILPGSSVLEFGPAYGRMTKYMKEELQCHVSCVEIDKEAELTLSQYAEKVIICDIEQYIWKHQLKGTEFDYIIFADVLEHLVHPENVLKEARSFLKKNGKLFISVPNISHNAVIESLYLNQFDYQESGILDKTHLRFFTKDSLERMIQDCGLTVCNRTATYYYNEMTGILEDFSQCNSDFARILEQRPYAYVYQFVYTMCRNGYEADVCINEIRNVIGKDFFQIYSDDGCGFSENDSIKQQYDTDCSEKVFTFTFKEPRVLKQLRADPSDKSCICRLRNISIEDENGHSHQIGADRLSGNMLCSFQGVYVFDQDDPHFIISDLGMRISSVQITMEILCTNIRHTDSFKALKDIWNSLSDLEDQYANAENEIGLRDDQIAVLRKTAEQKDVIIASLEKNLDNRNIKITTLNADISQRNTTIQDLSTSLNETYEANASLQHQIDMYQQSTCWKITKPLRVMVTGVRIVFSAQTYGKLLKKIYMAIPINVQTKVRIKGGIFRVFAPLIKNTTAYKDWKNYTTSTAQMYVANPKVQISEAENQGFVGQIMNIPYTGNSEEYVSKSMRFQYTEDDSVRYLAFYLPQYHPFPENNRWWGEGFTEWTNVTKAVPQFVGHNQPRLAGELGYYDLRNTDILRQQMELAKMYGIYGFCIYYYWFNGKKLMDKPLNLIMNHLELNLPFCLCWANENWSRKWDGKNQDILIAQDYNDDFPEKFIKDILPYMSDARYIRFQGKPVLIIYNANEIPNLKQTLQFWRNYCNQSGIGEIQLLAVDFALNNVSREAGFDGFVEFPPHSIYHYGMDTINSELSIVDAGYAGRIFDYGQIVREKRYLSRCVENYYKGIFLGWDNTARRPKDATVYHRFTISAFKEWLTDITKLTMEKHMEDDRYVFINAWNEWAEGTYLEPDRKYGYAALNSVREVLAETVDNTRRIIYVSHDACYNGAQLLSLNIIEQLTKVFHYHVVVILLRGGKLFPQFKEFASDFICLEQEKDPDAALMNLLKQVKCKIAMCNTVMTGDILKILTQQGIRCISMIHEMEHTINAYQGKSKLIKISEYAEKVVFASEYVLKSAEQVYAIPQEKVVISPQGCYKSNPYGTHNDTNRKEVRQKFGLSADTRIVLGVGFGDARKGIDLFVRTAIQVCESNQDIAFIWLGETDPAYKEKTEQLLSQCSCRDRIVFADATDDVFYYYSAVDLFVLTSREDPFPTVVMEAMMAGLPVVAFQGGGGYVEIITSQTGALVKMESWEDMAQEVCRLLSTPQKAAEMGLCAHRYAVEKFGFLSYIYELLSLLEEKYRKISVVIPNYNYERYLTDRIDSVLRQDYPIYEVILLDDCSKDHSVDIMEQYERFNSAQIKVYKNVHNSGNVFNQWEKGCHLATGEYIWIAEADDLSEPDFLSSIMNKMALDSSIILGYSQSYMMDENGCVTADNYFCYTDDIDDRIWRSDYVRDAGEEIAKRMAAKNTIPNVSAVVFKNRDFHDMFVEAKKFHVAGDWAFYVKLMESGGKVAFIAKSLNYHRRHSNSVTTDLNAQTHFDEICRMQDYVCERFPAEVDVEKVMEYRKNVKKILNV